MDGESLGFWSFVLAAIAHGVLTLLLIFSWRQRGLGTWLIVATGVTTLWASIAAAAYVWPESLLMVAGIGEIAQKAAWALFLASFVREAAQLMSGGTGGMWRWLVAVIGGLVLLLTGFDILAVLAGAVDVSDHPTQLFGLLLITVGSLALLENVYRLPDPDSRWSIRYLVLGLFGVMVYELVLYTGGFLFHGIVPDLAHARGLIYALIAPLIGVTAARNPNWKMNIFVSRQMVFHTVSLIAAGGYLIGISFIAFYIRKFGGDLGSFLTVAFVFATLTGLGLVLLSGRFRARVRVFIAKHFIAYSYDYREEWLSFIHTLSDTASTEELRVRIIRAICGILDSPGGALWQKGSDNVYRPVARWNMRGGTGGAEPDGSALINCLAARNWIIDLNELKAGDSFYEGLTVPDWSRDDPRAWLVIPLTHYDSIEGFLVAEQPRSAHTLTWEGRDLVKTAGRQAASYLAEQRAEKVVAESREFEAFNRRFAYVMHDIKNLASQLSLMVKNAERHAANPDFQKDMLETVKDAATKMSLLLDRLNRQSEQGLEAADVNLVDLAGEAAKPFAVSHRPVAVTSSTPRIWVTVDSEQLSTAIRHLVQNGFEAGAEGADVSLELGMENGQALLRVSDTGCGMSADFIEKELFQPFRTTKPQGYGIGMYETRSIVEKHGGQLEVKSTLGAGTEFTIRLPVARRMLVQAGS